jgi:hypothetical protein
VHRRKGISLLLYVLFWPALFTISTFSFVLRKCFGILQGRFSKVRPKKKTVVLGYVPVELFIALCLLTFGLYPYAWLWGNSGAFVSLCGDRLQEKRVKLYAAIGFCVQLILPVSFAIYGMGRFTGPPQLLDLAINSAFLYAAAYILLILPQRCYYFFDIRWNLRSAVEAWDKDGVMIDRTMTSWFKLFAFGSIYIQLHANRLIGLGMPGFAGQDDIMPDFSVRRWLQEYVIIRRPAIRLSDAVQENVSE